MINRHLKASATYILSLYHPIGWELGERLSSFRQCVHARKPPPIFLGQYPKGVIVLSLTQKVEYFGARYACCNSRDFG
jgi:hypothetical protein